MSKYYVLFLSFFPHNIILKEKDIPKIRKYLPMNTKTHCANLDTRGPKVDFPSKTAL